VKKELFLRGKLIISITRNILCLSVLVLLFSCMNKGIEYKLFETDQVDYGLSKPIKIDIINHSSTNVSLKSVNSKSSMQCRIYVDSIYTKKIVRRLPIRNFGCEENSKIEVILDSIYISNELLLDKYITNNICGNFDVDIEIKNQKLSHTIICNGRKLEEQELDLFELVFDNLEISNHY